MAIEVVEKYVDMANEWVVRVTNGTHTLFLRFKNDPTNQEIRDRVNEYIAQRQAQLNAIQTEEAEHRTLMDYIYAYDSTWTNAQTRTLLEAIITRIKKRNLTLT